MKLFPFLLAILSAALFGASTPVSKFLLASFSTQQLAGLLYLGAASGSAAVLIFSRMRWFSGRLNRANFLRIGGAIVFGGVLGPLFLLLGLRSASASSVSLWLNLELVATALLGVLLFHDHLGMKGWLGAGCALAAGALLSWGEGAAGLRAGAFLGLACLCWGLDNHLTALVDGLLPVQSTFWKGLAAGSFNLILGLYFHPLSAHVGPLGIALVTGMISYGASIVLYITAAQSLGATRSQMLFATAPFFGMLFSLIGLHETPSMFQAAAFIFQALGIVFIFRDQHSHLHTHEAMEHTHPHRHDDAHHTHTHPGEPASLRHSHPHRHEAMTHTHPHWPDLHHRHTHSS